MFARGRKEPWLFVLPLDAPRAARDQKATARAQQCHRNKDRPKSPPEKAPAIPMSTTGLDQHPPTASAAGAEQGKLPRSTNSVAHDAPASLRPPPPATTHAAASPQQQDTDNPAARDAPLAAADAAGDNPTTAQATTTTTTTPTPTPSLLLF
jgi:hypothetical protein